MILRLSNKLMRTTLVHYSPNYFLHNVLQRYVCKQCLRYGASTYLSLYCLQVTHGLTESLERCLAEIFELCFSFSDVIQGLCGEKCLLTREDNLKISQIAKVVNCTQHFYKSVLQSVFGRTSEGNLPSSSKFCPVWRATILLPILHNYYWGLTTTNTSVAKTNKSTCPLHIYLLYDLCSIYVVMLATVDHMHVSWDPPQSWMYYAWS